MEAVKSHVSSLKKDLEAVKSKYNEVSEKLMEKTRQYQKLQVYTPVPYACSTNFRSLSHVAQCNFFLQGMYETLRR